MKQEELPKIVITGIKPSLHNQLINISKNLGVNLTSLVKPLLQDFADSKADHLKNQRKD